MNVYIGGPVVISDMQGPCPDGFHVPLKDEWQAIRNAYTGLGLSGGDNFATYLKMPKAGSRPYHDVSPFAVGSAGYYWSSSNYNNNYNNAWALLVYSHNAYPKTYDNEKGTGCYIRGLKNTPVTPTSSRTVLYQGTGSAGIYWNSIDGLISISADGTTWYTLMDKNLGATTVYNYGDTLTDANCGNVFQWGNNYAFPGTLSSASITTSGTQVNASTYGPGNYYSSNKFIIGNNDWDSSLSTNLRGGVSQGSGIKSVEVQNIYIGEYGWQPGANTIAYYPFKSDILDHSGNNKNFTGSGYSFANNMITTTGQLTGPIVTPENTTGDRTISAWMYRVKVSHGYVFRSSNYGTEGHLNPYDGENGNRPGASLNINGWKRNRPSASELPAMGSIILMTWTKTGTTMKLYVNGVLTSTNSSLSTATWTSQNGITKSYLDPGTYGEIIVEDKIWTDAEVEDYYNLTKSNYGL